MKQLIGPVLERLGRGERVALVTVLETEGSVPRSTGAAMAVFPDGRIAGTVGGGAGGICRHSAGRYAGRRRIARAHV